MCTEADSALDGWKMQVSSVCWVGFRIGLTLRYHGYATSSAGSVQRISPVRSHREDRAVNDRLSWRRSMHSVSSAANDSYADCSGA